MNTRTSFGLAVLMVAVLALAVPQSALAAGADTNYGTTITNSVTIQYGSGPSTITTSTSVDFLVDRVLDWTIAPSAAATVGVFPGSTNNAVAFSVQNTTNGVVDLLLAVPLSAPAPSGAHLMYLDNGGSAGIWDAGDTLLPAGPGGFYLDEVAEDAALSVLLVINVASAATTADTYTYEITSTPRAGGTAGLGAVLADDSGSADISTQVQNVYNDGAGYNDAAGDFVYTAFAAFQVVVPSLTATKTAVVTSDPVNGAVNPKAIPGATVHYTISITNTGTATATAVDITDDIPANTTFLGGLALTNAGVGGTEAYEVGPPARVTVTGESIAAGVTMTLEFDVTID